MPPGEAATASRARLAKSSTDHDEKATPTIGTSRSPVCTILYSDGKIDLRARSPVAPKKTNASDGVWGKAPATGTPRQSRGDSPSQSTCQRADARTSKALKVAWYFARLGYAG